MYLQILINNTTYKVIEISSTFTSWNIKMKCTHESINNKGKNKGKKQDATLQTL